MKERALETLGWMAWIIVIIPYALFIIPALDYYIHTI